MDFISGLPKSKGFDSIFVLVAETFFKEVVRLHGILKSIVSDRDPLFMSKLWQELFRSQGIELHMSSSYHPQSDGQTKVVNRCLESYF